jgi:hypothetical protein
MGSIAGILDNKFDHREPHRGDHGIQFDRVECVEHPFAEETVEAEG